MIDMNYTQEINDTIHGTIAYSGIEREVMGTPFFNRLHRILQSSLVYLTYPSNKVKRFEHSVGTMHLAGLFFFRSICNTKQSELDKFFGEISDELVRWNKSLTREQIFYIHRNVVSKYKNEAILNAPYPKSVLYDQNTPANLPSEYLFSYFVVYQSIRLVGMLHDVGHLPYSHILEHALHLLYQKVTDIPEADRKESHAYFLQIMEKYCANTGFAIHEELGKHFVDKIFESIVSDLPKGECEELYFLAAVLYFTKQILNAEEEGANSIFGDLHRIVAGTVDCDRMDYCCRDAYCAGVTKEPPNYDRIISTLSIVYRDPEQPLMDGTPAPSERAHFYFAPSTKAIHQIERLLEQRWMIFAMINYHHRVHKHELLMQSAIAELGLEEMASGNSPEELVNILPLQVSSIWQLVKQMDAAAPIDYIALQLDDSWLDTLLKHKYFEKYGETYLSFATNGNDKNWHRLDELISAKKHYLSLIKRSGSFRSIDEALYNELKEKGMLERCGLLLNGEASNYSQFVSRGEYAFNKLLRTIALTNELRQAFFEKLEAQIKYAINEHDYNIVDCFLSDCTFKPGLRSSEPLYITSPELDNKPFSHYSALYDILMMRKKILPCFHVYYLPRYDVAHNEYHQANTAAFRTALVDAAVQVIGEVITE